MFLSKGVFEGRLTDFGSYDQCLSIADNDMIGSAQYCSLDLIPTIPRPMPKQQNLFHRIPNLLPLHIQQNQRNALNLIANEASVFYWVSYRTGICTSNRCTTSDIQSIAEQGILCQ